MERYFNYSRLAPASSQPALGATIAVYLTGTLTLAPLFSDNLATPTPKSNPFTADATSGFFYFYTHLPSVDIRFSGGGIVTPYTWGDVPTNLAGLFDTIINITDYPYNCVGDGTTDNAVGLQAAIAAGMANSQAIFVPQGVFVINTGITITAAMGNHGPIIYGTGEGSVILNKAPANNSTFSFGDNQYYRISNLQIAGVDPYPNAAIEVIGAGGAGFASFDHLYLFPNGIGFRLNTCNTFDISDCVFWKSGWVGSGSVTAGNPIRFFLGDGTFCNAITLRNNSAGCGTIANQGGSVKFAATTNFNITIIGNDFEGTGAATHRSLELTNVSNATIAGNYLDGTEILTTNCSWIDFNANSQGNTGTHTLAGSCDMVSIRHAVPLSVTVGASCTGTHLDHVTTPTLSDAGVGTYRTYVNNSGIVADKLGKSGFIERDRTVNAGQSTAVAFSAGDFTANAATWTVTSGMVKAHSYAVIGTTLTVWLAVEASTLAAGPATAIRVAIPGSFVSAGPAYGTLTYINNGGAVTSGQWAVAAAGTTIIMYTTAFGTWANGVTNNTVYLTATFPIQ